MHKKEAYRHILPHFQQPGQAYFVTWNLQNAVPKKALVHYTQKLESLRNQIRLYQLQRADQAVINPIRFEMNLVRKKYIKAYDDLLDAARKPGIDLSEKECTDILISALLYWEGKKLRSKAFSIMPNHIHWVFQLFEKDEKGALVYLQDILHSVKLFTANQINRKLQIEGKLWQKESFDTTIRDDKHMYYAIRYTIQNPVKAGLVNDWHLWKGTWIEKSLMADY